MKQMKTFRSKIDWWLLVIMCIATLLPLYFQFFVENKGVGVYVISLLILILSIFCLYIRYQISGGTLTILMLFGKKSYDISRIQYIEKSHCAISAPAASVDRLLISFPQQLLYVSPKNKREFVQALLKANPNIVVKD
ncbi:MAG: hypothetical protein E7069_13305 [Bacteroidales bacterium]|jgi:hypothetical protein|nr:hypothetical protein [Bacteroidales bacterium]